MVSMASIKAFWDSRVSGWRCIQKCHALLLQFERDVAIWNHKQFEDKPLLVKEDKMIARYRRWYSQFYSENSPKHTFQKETLEW